MSSFLTESFQSLGIDPALGGLALGALFGWVARGLRGSGSGLAEPPARQPRDVSFSTERILGTSHRVSLKVDGQDKVLEGEVAAKFFEALHSGQKISAIQILREATGLGLKESKDLVDAMESSKL